MADRVGAFWRRHGLPWIPVLLGPLALFGPMLARGRALFWGTPLLQFTPWRSYAKQLVLSGQLPLWNPALGMGAPLLANYQSALLYPPNWLLLLVEVAWGQTLLVLLHLMLAGAGMVLLARRLRLNPLAQTISGLSFALSGYLVARAGFLSINAAAAWLPWIVLAADGLIGADKPAADPESAGQGLPQSPSVGKRPGFRAVAGLAAVLAMQWLAGHAQIAWYSLLLAAVWLVYRSVSRGGWNGLGRPAIRFALAGLLAFVIAAAQLLPTLEYLRISDRSAGLDREFATTYSLWPWRLVGIFAPDMYGNPRDGNFWGYGNYWEDAIYLGVLPALLALAALFRRRGRRLRWLLAGGAAASLLLALGDHTPVFPFLYDHIPTFNLFQAPTRWSLWLVFCLALLAGLGAEGWGRAEGRGLYWLRLGTAGSAAVLGTALVGQSLIPDTETTFIPAVAQAGVLLLACGALGLTRRDRPPVLWQALAAGLVLIDLVWAGRGANPSLPVDALAIQSSGSSEGSNAGRWYMAEPIEQAFKFDQAFRFDGFQPDFDWASVRRVALPNTGLLQGLDSANNFDPIRPDRYAAWIGHLERLPLAQREAFYAHMDVAWAADAELEYRPVDGARRAWFVDQVRWVEGTPEAMAVVFDERLDLDHTAVLEGTAAAAAVDGGGSGSVDRIEQSGPNRVELEVSTDSGAWLVLADCWYPGWNAYLDDRPATSYSADGVFRALWVPGGSHRVSFRYQPISFSLGLALSVAGLMTLALLWRSTRRTSE